MRRCFTSKLQVRVSSANEGSRFTKMKLTPRPLLTVFLLGCTGAWAQDSNCHFSEPVGTQTRCPCTGALMIVTTCQGDTGQGCADVAFFDFCGSTCAVGVSSGCNPRGPKIERPLTSDIDRLFVKQAHTSFVTCNQDNRPFEEWLAKANSSRQQL